MKLYLEFIFVCCFEIIFAMFGDHYEYEKLQKIAGLGKNIPNFRHLNKNLNEYPEPLPSSTSNFYLIRQPYPSLYQGLKSDDDVRVFRKTFQYPATPVGHKIFCEDLLDCTITFISVETKNSIPIILRGGAGYRHFSVVVRSKPWEPLEGHIHAYCHRMNSAKII